jgi:phospholipase/carboxylesterase
MGRAEDLAPFARSLGVAARFVFPEAPIDLSDPAFGRLPGRAWWPTDRDASGGTPPRSVPDLVPVGLPAARACIDELLQEIRAESPGAPLIVGGFSQGAMLTLDWTLRVDVASRPRALVQLSGAPMCGDQWAPRIPSCAGQRVFFSHGRSDAELSFETLEAFQRGLAAAGWEVTWFPFDGGHEVPLAPLRALKKFLQSL